MCKTFTAIVDIIIINTIELIGLVLSIDSVMSRAINFMRTEGNMA